MRESEIPFEKIKEIYDKREQRKGENIEAGDMGKRKKQEKLSRTKKNTRNKEEQGELKDVVFAK